MKKIFYTLSVALVALVAFSACNDRETYADQKKKEVSAISAYIAENNVSVISEETFAAQGHTTNLEKNEFVLFESNGIYLQIVRKGCGEPLKSGETATLLCRFTEHNLMTDTIQLTNDILYMASIPEKLSVTNSYGTFQGSFDKGQSLMYSVYSSQSVPGGWLYPLTYINVGRPVDENDEIAKIRVIVPHSQGQSNASQSVYPCLYDITYQKGL